MNSFASGPRSSSPDESGQNAGFRSRITPELLRQFGITRVGDVTDLDVLGVQVWFATRPNSRGLSVAQGKGLTAEQAKISAIMEAIEGVIAEDTQRHVCCFGSISQMETEGHEVVALETVGRVSHSMLDPERERAWVRGRSVRTGSEVLSPFELIGLDFRADFVWDRVAFHMSSEGLAAGLDYDRTVLHALLELVENDACFLIDALETRNVAPKPIVLKTGINPQLDALILHLARLGVTPRFYDLTSDLGVPVIVASLDRPILATHGPSTRNSAGIASRLNAHDAALAALLEAIQSRLTDISGARDDLSPARYQPSYIPNEQWSSNRSAVLEFDAQFSYSNDGQPSWKALADHLLAAGVADIYVFDLETGVEGLFVVRVLASGLHATNSGLQYMTPRLFESVLSAGGEI